MNINDELGRLPAWSRCECVDCRRTPREARLNIEGVIHHGATLRCVDRKSCERLKRRLPTTPVDALMSGRIRQVDPDTIVVDVAVDPVHAGRAPRRYVVRRDPVTGRLVADPGA